MSNDKNPTLITLPSETPKGDLLTEVTRVFLHSGTPSALLTRIVAGVDEYVNNAATNEEDWKLGREFQRQLVAMYEEWKKKEDEYYK